MRASVQGCAASPAAGMSMRAATPTATIPSGSTHNALVTAWPELTKLAAAPTASSDAPVQETMI